jgi:hypothetical protein
MSGTPLLTDAMVTQLGVEAEDAAAGARQAEAQRDNHEAVRQNYAETAQRLSAIRSYMKPRIGRSVAEVLEEVRAELAEAEARYAEKAAIAERARERVRDLEGYMRIAREMASEAPASPEPREGERA